MELLKVLEVVIYLSLLVMVDSQTEYSTTASYSRDYLFEKPESFVRQKLPKSQTRFSEEEKKLILDIHNSYRSLVDPPATNMRELTWDDDLEEFSRNHTLACTGAHTPGSVSMVKDLGLAQITWHYMGENLFYAYAPWYSIKEALWLFWEEGSKYDIENDVCTHKQTCGHYRVLVTANSSYIGCALNTCDQFSNSNYPTPAIFMSCTYNGRNLIYYRPYIVGERASQCSHEMTEYQRPYKRYGLCTSSYNLLFKLGFDGNTSVIGLPSDHLTTPSITTKSSSDTTDDDYTTLDTSTTFLSTSSKSNESSTESDGTINVSARPRSRFSWLLLLPCISFMLSRK